MVASDSREHDQGVDEQRRVRRRHERQIERDKEIREPAENRDPRGGQKIASPVSFGAAGRGLPMDGQLIQNAGENRNRAHDERGAKLLQRDPADPQESQREKAQRVERGDPPSPLPRRKPRKAPRERQRRPREPGHRGEQHLHPERVHEFGPRPKISDAPEREGQAHQRQRPVQRLAAGTDPRQRADHAVESGRRERETHRPLQREVHRRPRPPSPNSDRYCATERRERWIWRLSASNSHRCSSDISG